MIRDYKKLVKALRYCGKKYFTGDECKNCGLFGTGPLCSDKLKLDAAAAIEALQAEVERLADGNEELREQQTYIDRYGNEWHTSAKDVPNYAYEHGYADGMAEAKAQLPKRGEWVYNDGDYIPYCSICGMPQDTETPYCHFCGAKMEVQDGK